MEQAITTDQCRDRIVGMGSEPFADHRRELRREIARRHAPVPLAIIGYQSAPRSAAQTVRLLQYRVEYRGEIAGRGVDDAEHLGGRGLLLQGFARLGDQPRVLHRDDRLRREVFEESDLLVGERANLLAIEAKETEDLVFLREGHDK